MALSRRTARPRFTLLVLVLAAVTVLTLGFRSHSSHWISGVKSVATDVFSPVQSAASAIFTPVGNFFEGAASYGSLRSANAHLHQEVTRLRAEAAQAGVYQQQAARLAAQAHLPFAPNITHRVVADVIATSPSNFQHTVQLDRGTAQGVRDGMPAVSGTGLVGRVVAVSRSRSTVQLVTDPASNVGVVFGKKGSLALASGQGVGRPLSVSLVGAGTKLLKGELMATSGGQGDLYPPGIPVGTVEGATLDPGQVTDEVELAPVAQLGQLQYVTVLLWTPSAGLP
ncbi:MAG: rod shape-determining protein MreC [Acidimicrobiales bacterium]